MGIGRRTYPLIAIIGIAIVWLIAPSVFFEGGPTNAEGAVVDKVVSGTVYDQTDQPLAGADVTVEIWGGSWPDQDFFRTSETTVTDLGGHYEVTIDANFWDPHNTIKVIATNGFYQGISSTEADAEPAQTVDVHLETAIPEFSGPLGLMAISGFMTCLVFWRARSRIQC